MLTAYIQTNKGVELMLYIIAGLVIGLVVGLKLNIVYNPEYAVYISLAILAIINTIFNMLRERKNGEPKASKSLMFLITDMVFALFLGYIGEQLELPIYLAAVFAFGNNIYKNVKVLSESLFDKININSKENR